MTSGTSSSLTRSASLISHDAVLSLEVPEAHNIDSLASMAPTSKRYVTPCEPVGHRTIAQCNFSQIAINEVAPIYQDCHEMGSLLSSGVAALKSCIEFIV